MGLIKEGDDTAILTDILGDEDHMGDMDFKVIGNEDGISAVQMDIKIDGLQMELMADALEQARQARLDLLGQMKECISGPNTQLSAHAPREVHAHSVEYSAQKCTLSSDPKGPDVLDVLAPEHPPSTPSEVHQS